MDLYEERTPYIQQN